MSRIDASTAEARKQTDKAREKLQKDFDKAREEEEKILRDKIAKLEEQMKTQKLDSQEIILRVAMAQEDGQRRMQAKLDQLQRERDRETNRIETELNASARCKTATSCGPCSCRRSAARRRRDGLLLRRRQEQEGASQARLRSSMKK